MYRYEDLIDGGCRYTIHDLGIAVSLVLCPSLRQSLPMMFSIMLEVEEEARKRKEEEEAETKKTPSRNKADTRV